MCRAFVGFWLMALVVTIVAVVVCGYGLDFVEKIKMCLGEAILMAMLLVAVWMMVSG